MTTSNVNNGGVYHLGRGGVGGPAACRNKRAHMSVERERFKLMPRQCVRCAAVLAKWEAKAVREAEAGR